MDDWSEVGDVSRRLSEQALIASTRVAVAFEIFDDGVRLVDLSGLTAPLLGVSAMDLRRNAHGVRERLQSALASAIGGEIEVGQSLSVSIACADRNGRKRRLSFEGRIEAGRSAAAKRLIGVMGAAEAGKSEEARTRELMRMLRLSEIAMCAPTVHGGLQEAADAIADGGWVFLACSIGLVAPEGAGLNFVASAGCADDRRVRLELQRMAERALASRSGAVVETWPGAPHQRAMCSIMEVADEPAGVLALRYEPRALAPSGLAEELASALGACLANLIARSTRQASASSEDDPSVRAKLDSLTRRPQEVLFEIVERGGSNAELGERLGVATNTIKVHCREVYKALNVKSRAEATALVVKSASNWLALQRQRGAERT